MAMSLRNIHLLQVLLLLSLIGLTMVILWPFQRALDESMEEFKLQLISYMEGRLGREIEYGSISPALFRFLEIRDLSIYRADKPDDSLIRVRRVRVSYNILKLMSADPLSAVDEIRFENSRFKIDLEQDAPLLELVRELRSGGGELPALGEDIRLRGRNLSFELVDGPRRYLAEDIFFDFERLGERYEGSIRAELYFADSEADPFSFGRGRLDATGSAALDFESLEFSLGMRGIESDLFSIPQITLYLEVDPERIRLRKIQDREPFDLSLSYMRWSGKSRISFQSQRFVPASIGQLQGALSIYNDWLLTELDGVAALDFDPEEELLEYQGDLRLSLPTAIFGFPAESQLILAGDRRRIQFERLYLDTGIGRADYRGDLPFDSLLPDGFLSLRDVALPTGDFLNLDLQLDRRGERSRIDGDLRIDGILFPELAGSVSYRGRRWEYALTLPVQNRGAAMGRIDAEGIFARDQGYLQSVLSLEGIRLETIQTLASGDAPFEWLAEEALAAEGSLFFYQEGERFSFLAPEMRIAGGEDSGKEIRFQINGSNSGYGLLLHELRYGIYNARGGLELLRSGEGYDFLLDAEVQDIPYAFRGRFEDSQLVAEGTYLETLYADIDDPVELVLVTSDFPVPFPQVLSRLDLNLRGSKSREGPWRLWSEQSRIRNIPGQEGENSLELTFRADEEEINLFDLRYVDQLSRIRGNGYFRLQAQGAAAELPIGADGWLQLAGEDSDESYQLILSLEEEEVESDFQFRNAPLDRFGALPVSGLFSGDLTVKGLPSDPDIFLRLELAEGEINQDPFEMSTVLTLEEENLAISEFSLGYLGTEVRNGSGLYRLDLGELAFTADFRFPLRNEILQGDIGVSARTIGLNGREELTEVLRNPFDGTVEVSNIRRGEEVDPGWQIDFGYDGALFAFYGGPEGAISGTINENREFSLAAEAPLPARLRLDGRIAGGEIDATLERLTIDLTAVQRIFNFPFFAIQSGVLEGNNLEVTGAVNDPDFFGELQLKELTATSAVLPEEIGPFSTLLRLEEKRLSIQDAYLPVGLGSVSADLSFIMEHWVPSTYDIRLEISPEQGLRVKTEISKLQLDGYARGVFTIAGDNLGTQLGGDLRLSSAVLTLTNQEPTEPVRSERGFTTDLTLTTGKSVEFLWPSLNLPIIRSFARTDQEIRIQSDRSADTFSVEGEVEIQGGIILYFQRNFYIKEGSIRFRENEIRFDPILTARAELREVDAEGEDVQIFLIVDERPLSKFAPRFESIPSYSDVEIAALLGTSIFGSPVGETINPSDALIQTSDLLVGQLGIVRSFEQSMKEILNLDLFSVRTQIFQNILLDRMVVEEQEDEFTTTNSSAIGRYLDNTTLFLGKYFGDDVFLEAMLQVESNEQFFDDFGGEQVYELDTEVSVEWQTPFFLFDFSVSPDFRDIVSSVTTARVGLSWALSF